MARQQLNLGILAHVDAGKTTLTERLLFEAGVDHRRSAASMRARLRPTRLRSNGSADHDQVRGRRIPARRPARDLLDTPGHPDFIAEVERVLSVLDGAVLVLSAVEGVQPQTRILF